CAPKPPPTSTPQWGEPLRRARRHHCRPVLVKRCWITRNNAAPSAGASSPCASPLFTLRPIAGISHEAAKAPATPTTGLTSRPPGPVPDVISFAIKPATMPTMVVQIGFVTLQPPLINVLHDTRLGVGAYVLLAGRLTNRLAGRCRERDAHCPIIR